MTSFLFIGGTGRSGTNITKKIFSAHPDVASLPFETRFNVDPKGIYRTYASLTNSWSPFICDYEIKNLENYLHSLNSVNQFLKPFSFFVKSLNRTGSVVSTESYFGWELRKWIPGYKSLVTSLINDLVQFQYRAVYPGTKSYQINNRMYFAQDYSKSELQKIFHKFISSCYISILQHQKKSFYVEDNTFNMLFAQEISEIFPQSKFLNIIRHPFDVISSLMNQRWTPSEFSQSCNYYESMMRKWLRIREHIPQNFYLEVKLESIVNNKQETILKMCEFCGINMTEEMLDIDLSRSNQERYKNHFSHKQIDQLNKQFGSIIEEFDYS